MIVVTGVTVVTLATVVILVTVVTVVTVVTEKLFSQKHFFHKKTFFYFTFKKIIIKKFHNKIGNQIVMKLKNSNCDETQKLKL